MATTKKPLKGAKPASKKLSAPVKAVAKKTTSAKPAVKPKSPAPVKVVAKKVAVVAKKTIPAKPKATAKTTNKIEPKKVKSVLKKAAITKVTKPAPKKTVKKAVIKEVAKKIEKPVKKTTVPEKKTAKPAPVIKQVIVPEKKAKVPHVPIPTPSVKAAAKVPAKPSKPVVIPKTSTDKMVDYEPDFLKSVLDSPVNIPSSPTMRYSDGELMEFRDLINKKLDAAKKELAYLQGLITRKDEMGGDETDNRYMTMEDGGMSMEREQLSQMASRQITFIDHLEKAIMRIENKTYGVCRVTGKLIDKARLRAVPHATLSMEAKLGIVK